MQDRHVPVFRGVDDRLPEHVGHLRPEQATASVWVQAEDETEHRAGDLSPAARVWFADHPVGPVFLARRRPAAVTNPDMRAVSARTTRRPRSVNRYD